jgi:colanic acid biosynthesis glycosyl transferase WcaI
MQALLINQYFWPDMAATAQLLTDLAEDLVAAGWEVRVVSGRGSYAPGREGKLPARERYRGVTIRRVWCTNFGRGSFLGRLLDYATFLVAAGWWVAVGGWRRSGHGAGPGAEGQPGAAGGSGGGQRPVVLCLSTPPLLAVLGFLARLRGAGFVVKVEDLYPDVAVALGTLHAGSVVTRFFQWVSRRMLRHADAVVALDAAMQAVLLARGAERVEVIPNWADGRELRPDPEAGEQFRVEHGLGRCFVVLYAGNLGLAHRFDAVTGAARTLSERGTAGREVLFLFVGAGPRLEEVRRGCEGLANVRFLPYQPRDTLRFLYNAADLHLVTLRDEVTGLVVPSKVAAALACGKPVLLVGAARGALAGELRQAGAGWSCEHDPAQVAVLLEALAGDAAAVAAAGARARALFEMAYDRQQATGRWGLLLSTVASTGLREGARG